ncbi:transcriptional regulator FtsR [Actinomyces minihominis]|uniref:transcriptional regulator FtsR n=1 Tax=Actinomyces minihominis TaxID=2002838 RepID=UPI000C06F069|nr:MerR family transcriptional regulator [Actinomyces minihominis]
MGAVRSGALRATEAASADQRPSQGPWPRGVSRDAVISIGQVVKILAREFPATTVSKVRFLEEKGLVTPHRSAAGYRKYSQADIERIRFILTKQRDSYAPLKVIGDELQSLDAGHDVELVPKARLITSDGITVAHDKSRTVTVRELGELSGCSREQLEAYVRFGLISPDLGGRFPSATIRVVKLINQLVAAGIPARNLRAVRAGADRSADIIDQAVSSTTRRDRPGDRERARSQAEEMGELTGALHSALLQLAIEALGE